MVTNSSPLVVLCVCLSCIHASGFIATPFLPPLLAFQNGSKVTTPAAWEERRIEVKHLLEETLLGSLPEPSPLLSAKKVNFTEHNGVHWSLWSLEFDVSHGGVIESVAVPVEVFAPASHKARHPVFLTQWNHREWALNGVTRGYLSVLYPGADVKDVSPQFQKAFPNKTFALIMARAYVGSRVLDFVLSQNATAMGLPQVNPTQIAVSGHSRNGKQSLVFAAFDERITAVVGSSPGAPIASPYRFTSSNFYGEGPATGGVTGEGTRGWWIPSSLKYAGHPERMPIDGHGVVGLIAPRACAIATAHQDPASDMVFADEMNLRESSKVYSFVDAPEKLRNIYRYGGHHGFDDITTYFDWFDRAFGRCTTYADALQSSGILTADSSLQFPMTWLTPAGFDWDLWNRSTYGDYSGPPTPKSPLQSRVSWLLALHSDEPPGLQGELSAFSVGSTYGEESEAHGGYISDLLGHIPDGTNLKFQPFSFGDYVSAQAYWPDSMPVDIGHPQPAAIWLHPYSYNTGYTPTYRQSHVHYEIAKAGFIVMAYDQVGFGIRNTQGGNRFYARHGAQASLLGQMVKDARSAVDFMICRSSARATPLCKDAQGGEPDNIPYVNSKHIYILGYSLGGNVALHTAALDTRIAGVGAFAAFTPFRNDTLDKPTGGLRRLYELHAILPRLGFFAQEPHQVPYDYEELLTSIAPRPTLLYTPLQDRDATFTDVDLCVKAATDAWVKAGAASKLVHKSPDEITVMEGVQTQVAVNWLKETYQSATLYL